MIHFVGWIEYQEIPLDFDTTIGFNGDDFRLIRFDVETSNSWDRTLNSPDARGLVTELGSGGPNTDDPKHGDTDVNSPHMDNLL